MFVHPFWVIGLEPHLFFETSFLSKLQFFSLSEHFFDMVSESGRFFSTAKPKIKPYNQAPEPHPKHPKHPKPWALKPHFWGFQPLTAEHAILFLPRVVLDIREVQLSESTRGNRRESVPNSIFFPQRGGDSNLKVSQTQGRRRTKMTHFWIWGSNTGKVGGQKWGKIATWSSIENFFYKKTQKTQKDSGEERSHSKIESDDEFGFSMQRKESWRAWFSYRKRGGNLMWKSIYFWARGLSSIFERWDLLSTFIHPVVQSGMTKNGLLKSGSIVMEVRTERFVDEQSPGLVSSRWTSWVRWKTWQRWSQNMCHEEFSTNWPEWCVTHSLLKKMQSFRITRALSRVIGTRNTQRWKQCRFSVMETMKNWSMIFTALWTERFISRQPF